MLCQVPLEESGGEDAGIATSWVSVMALQNSGGPQGLSAYCAVPVGGVFCPGCCAWSAVSAMQVALSQALWMPTNKRSNADPAIPKSPVLEPSGSRPAEITITT